MVVLAVAIGITLFLLWVYAILDVIATDRTKGSHKLIWLTLTIFLPGIGSAAWLVVGRPRRQPLGIEDRPDWAFKADRILKQQKPDK